MISFDEAIELIRSVATPLGTETEPLESASERVLAAPVVAQIDSPRADVSAMDGYAVRDDDLANLPAALTIIGESFAGAGWRGTIAPGTCARIFTGAPVPSGANRIVIQESVRRDGEVAIIDERPGDARHIRKRGSDFAVGDELLAPGRLLDPRAIVAAAGADLPEVQVYRRVGLGIFSTGDELADPGDARSREDAIPESVSLGVAALARRWGGHLVSRMRLRDELSAMCNAAARAVERADVLVVTGGASVGERDFAKAMFEPLGLDLIFSKLAIKPGKPVWLGRVNDTLVMGLPGNPTSALVTARLLLAPLLAGLAGRAIESALEWRQAPLSGPLGPCDRRETFHRAILDAGAASTLAFQDSSAQKALAQADVLVRQRPNTPAMTAWQLVDILDF